jgi:TRAP-type C4-dicarboxylate transport system substrate-binding protein
MRRLGRWFIVGLVSVLAFGIVEVPAPAGPRHALAADPVVIRAIMAWPGDCNCVSQYKRYIEEVNKRGKGKVEIKLLGGPEIVKPFEQFQALRSGIADATHTAPGYFVGETIEGAVFEMLDPGDYGKFLKGLRGEAMDVINQAFREKSGVRFVALTIGGTRFRFMMVKPITGLEDLKGKRIRVFGSQTAKVVQAFGASPATIPPAELYPALQRGVVDGAIRAPDDAWSFGERDVYKSMISTPIQLAPGGMFIATRVWDKLPPDVQQLLTSVAVELEPQMMRYYGESDDKAIELLKPKGLRVIEIPPADQKRLVDARNLYWTDVVSKSPVLGARLRTILEPYSK